MGLDADRTAELEAARARALARDRFQVELNDAHVTTLPFGACVLGTARAVVVLSGDDPAALGGVLLWAERVAAPAVELVAAGAAGLMARRASVLDPGLRVWRLDGTDVEPASPDAPPVPHPVPEGIESLVAIIERSAADVVVEDGIVRAELAGLEIARIVADENGPVLEVGVGRFDREAGALLHAGRDPETALGDVIDRLGPHRRTGAPSHAVNRIGRERWIRHLVVEDPGLVGVHDPVLVEPVPPRRSLLDDAPASLVARDGDRAVLVMCSAGVDLGLVPAAVDLVVRHQPDEVRFVVPERDQLPHLERLASRLPVPATGVGVPPPRDGTRQN